MARARTSRSKPVALELRELTFRWPGAQGFGLAVDHFRVARGERVLLLGPSGSGKSTLLSLICGVVVPEHGRIDVLGKDIVGMNARARDRFRADHFGIVFQMFNLLPYVSAVDNVLLPLSFSSVRRERAVARGGMEAEARRLLDALRIDDAVARAGGASQLSIGQQQRVAVARALIGEPEIVVADEPTSALDDDAQDRFLDLLFAQLDAAGATLVMVSHDKRLARRFDRSIRLEEIARLIEEAPA